MLYALGMITGPLAQYSKILYGLCTSMVCRNKCYDLGSAFVHLLEKFCEVFFIFNSYYLT